MSVPSTIATATLLVADAAIGRLLPIYAKLRRVRLIVATCAVEYQGRLGARLAPATRLIVMKADGSLAIHSDSKAYKPLNWMNPPCSITETADSIVAVTPKGESLRIELIEVFSDLAHELGDDPGLEKDGVEAELQELLAAHVVAIGPDLTLIRREYPTDIGPVDLLCTDADGRTIVVEVKRVGEIAGVEQLVRYQERLDRDSRFAPTRGVFVAERIKPQARVLAESRGIECVEVDLATLRGEVEELTLF
jgi:endonuclease